MVREYIQRKNMSDVCGFHYQKYWMKTHMDGTMTQEEFDAWFDENCAKCYYMSEICMYGEV